MIKSLINKLPLVLLTFIVGCTAIDNFFGNDIIPPSQQMGTYIDSTMSVRTTIFKVDSTLGNLSGIGVVGSTIDPFVGRTTAGFFHTYLPMKFPTDSLFGYKAKLDSMFAIFHFSTHKGDTLNPIKISIYEISDSVLRPNYGYYLNSNPKLYYDDSKPPLVQFELRGELTRKVQLPEYFYEKFLITGPKNEAEKHTNPYFSDTVWTKTFKGFYITAEPITSGKGQLASINLDNSSIMRLHYHNQNTPKFDTTYREFIFYHVQSLYSIGFEVSDHDYSFSNQALGGINPSVIGDTTIEASTLYLQGLDGLGGLVTLDTAHLHGIRKKAAADKFSTVAVHRAIVRWRLTQQEAENYNYSAAGLGLYYSMVKKDFIADYSPAFIDQSTGTPVDMNPLGGTINRSLGYYEQNITSMVQKLISGKDVKHTVELLPLWLEMLGPSRTVVGGSASTMYKPEIIITYTLLR